MNRMRNHRRVSSIQGRATMGGGVQAPSSLLTGLYGYWPLSDLTDSSGFGNTLANNGAVTFEAGKVGNCANFVAASSQYLSRADNATLSTGDIDFTIALWAQIASKPAVGTIAAKGAINAANTYEWGLWYASAQDRFRFSVGDGNGNAGTVQCDNFGSPALNTWYFIVVWHDSVNNLVGIQVNNGTANTASYSNGSFDSTKPFTLGVDFGPNFYHDGKIDECGFWKKVLTTQEKTDLYNGGNGRTYPF